MPTTTMTGRPNNIHSGDRVMLENCPSYPRTETHSARIIGEPQLVKGVWVVPVRYNCFGTKSAVVRCDGLVKLRSRNVKLSKPAIITGIALAVVAVLGLWLAGNYNSLVGARNSVNNSRAKIDTQLTRRYELIDNIVSSVKGSQAQESEVFGKIAEARKIGGNSSDPTQQAQANVQIDQQIALLPRLQEAYPELRSNDQVSKLIAELQGTANSVREARDNYNNTATNYNTNVSSFPKNIFAGMFDFDQAKLFEASAQEKVNPKVDFSKDEKKQ
jgi:LemA protein